MNISAFRNLAYDTSLGDNVSIIRNDQGNGLETVKTGGLAGLFNRAKLTSNSAFQMLGDALKTEFKTVNGLSDAACTTSVNRAFSQALGKNFNLARAAGLQLTPSMLRQVLSAAQQELYHLQVKVADAFVERMGQPLPPGGLAPAEPNFGRAQAVAVQAMDLLEQHAFSTGAAKALKKSLTKLGDKLAHLSRKEPTHAADFERLQAQIKVKTGELDRLIASEGRFADELKANHPLSEANVKKFVGDWHQSALSVLREIGVPQEKLAELTPEQLVKKQPTYKDGICTNIKKVLPKGADDISKAVSKAVKAWAKANLTKDELTAFKAAISGKTPDSPRLSKRLKAARTTLTEAKTHWPNVTKTFTTLTAAGPVKLTSTMTSGVHLGGKIYGNDRTGGHTSGDKSTTDAVNVWQSQLRAEDGRSIFNAVRHGVCVADKLEGEERTNAAISRAEGVAKAVFLARPDLLAKADGTRGTEANPIEFDITNISLLSTVNEGDLVAGQHGAFEAINGRQAPIKLVMAGGETIYIKPKFTMFNFSVNPMRCFSGTTQTKMNEAAFAAFSSRVDAYLAAHPDDPKRDVIRQLLFEVKEVVDHPQKYQRDSKDLYKASSRLAVLSNLIGEVPTYNCKSGKDRTGQNDVEAKFLATLIEHKMPIPELNAPLTPEQTRIYRDIALESGNLEIQQINTGLGGFKTSNKAANVTRMGGDDDKFMKGVFKGGGSAVSS